MPAAKPPEFRRRAVELARRREGFYNPRRRHSTCGYLSPSDYEAATAGRLTDAAA